MTQSQREAMAAKIIANPAAYAACCGCGSILSRKMLNSRPSRVCCNCASYRFEEGAKEVIDAVDEALRSQLVPDYE